MRPVDPFLVVLLAALAACKEKPSPSPGAALPEGQSSHPAPSTPPPPRPVATHSAAASSVGREAVVARVRALFDGYKDGSDYAFLRDACAPAVECFITMKDATPDAVQKSARAFFKDKRGVKYTMDEKALTVAHVEAGDVVRVPLTMVWGTLPEPEWAPDAPERALPDSAGDLVWERFVEHTAHVDVELAFDRGGRLTRYVELAVHRPKLKFQADEPCRELMGFARALPDREVVTDLGEVYAMEIMARGPQLARHVRLRDGTDAWVADTRSYVTGDFETGTHAGWSNCLVRVEASDGGG